MKLILICLKNLQRYIFDNIENLKKFGNNDITVITELIFFDKFKSKFDNLELVDCNELDDFGFNNKSKLNRKFRGGFWHLASLRLFYLYSYLEKTGLTNVVHLENDVMLFCNLDELHEKLISFDKTLLVLDNPKRCIPSFIFIPSAEKFKLIIDKYNVRKNDMKNLANIFKNYKNQFETLPIFKTDNSSENKKLLTKNYDTFKCIFDGAAIGQFLGGIDPRNSKGKNTIGFVNETCLINYSKYPIEWIEINNCKRPFILIENEKIPIINLHIHCKNIRKFIFY